MKFFILATGGMIAGVMLASVYGVALGLGITGTAQASTYHVNFEQGRDDRDGLSLGAAWKHAPGDPKAQGGPARTRLKAGDVVVFAANVRYRGTIIVNQSGAAGKPITFAGASSDATAIIDGSEPVGRVSPCRGPNDCGGAPLWSRISRVELDAPLDGHVGLFSSAGHLRVAQSPDPSEDFYQDEPTDMTPADGREMERGFVTLPHALASGLDSGGGSVTLWVKPNLVVSRPILGIEGDTVRFDPKGLQFYVDRPSRAAVANHISLLNKPGEYVIQADGRQLFAMLPLGSSGLSVASGRGQFRLNGASHIVIRNLGFENMSDGGQFAPYGVAVFSETRGSTGIRIENNRFRNFVMERGQGPLVMRAVEDLRVTGNRFDTISLGSGMRLTGSNILVENNEMQRIGRTGIMLMGTRDATVRSNRITDAKGVHGNGISAYLDNRNVRILGNTVLDAKQPATFHGDKKLQADNDILFANNLFIATPDALGALISWGATKGVTVRNNVLLGGKNGLRMNATNSGVKITDNLAAGLVVTNGAPANWQMAGNEWTALSFQQRKETPQPKVSKQSAGLIEALRSGIAPAGICTIIKRQSLPVAPPILEPSTIGALIPCQ